MKRIIALAIGLVLLLCACGEAKGEPPAAPELISHWTENDISLYYVEEGTVLLRHGNREETFSGWGKDWIDFRYQPGMAYFDIDGDGLNELLISTQVTHGETFSQNLHVITLDAEIWTDHVFTTDDVAAQFDRLTQYKRGEAENTIEVTIGEKTWNILLARPDFSWVEPSVSHCQIHFGGKITLQASSDALYGDFIANVTFDGEQFHIGDVDYLAQPFEAENEHA